MRKIIAIIMGMFFGAAGLFAQSANNDVPPASNDFRVPNPKAKEAAEKIKNAVSLSPEQYTRVFEAYKFFYGYLSQTQPNGVPVDSKVKASNKDIRDKDEKLKAILTPEQWQRAADAKIVP